MAAPASEVGAGVPQDHAGLAAALITTSFQLGSALGLAVFSGIATSRTSHLLAAHTPAPEALTAGFQRGLLVSALCLAAAGAIALRASNTRGELAATPGTQQTWNPPTTAYNTAQRNPGMAFNATPGFSLPSGAQRLPDLVKLPNVSQTAYGRLTNKTTCRGSLNVGDARCPARA